MAPFVCARDEQKGEKDSTWRSAVARSFGFLRALRDSPRSAGRWIRFFSGPFPSFLAVPHVVLDEVRAQNRRRPSEILVLLPAGKHGLDSRRECLVDSESDVRIIWVKNSGRSLVLASSVDGPFFGLVLTGACCSARPNLPISSGWALTDIFPISLASMKKRQCLFSSPSL